MCAGCLLHSSSQQPSTHLQQSLCLLSKLCPHSRRNVDSWVTAGRHLLFVGVGSTCTPQTATWTPLPARESPRVLNNVHTYSSSRSSSSTCSSLCCTYWLRTGKKSCWKMQIVLYLPGYTCSLCPLVYWECIYPSELVLHSILWKSSRIRFCQKWVVVLVAYKVCCVAVLYRMCAVYPLWIWPPRCSLYLASEMTLLRLLFVV